MKPNEDDLRLLRWLQTKNDHDRAEQDEVDAFRQALTAGTRRADADDEEITQMKKFMRGQLPPFDLIQALLPPTRPATRADRRAAEANAREWGDYRFTSGEIRAWLAAGVHPDEAALVRDLIEEGISPDGLQLVVTHPDTGERLSILDVARSSHLSHRNLCAALDDCKIERTRQPRWWLWTRRS